jgi:predicted RNA-binding Zn-ribbon protein involved in translation (DUF1610 family)
VELVTGPAFGAKINAFAVRYRDVFGTVIRVDWEHGMPRRHKLDLEKISASLETLCPHCGARIGPEEYKRVDGEQLECPKCGKQFIPGHKNQGAGGC